MKKYLLLLFSVLSTIFYAQGGYQVSADLTVDQTSTTGVDLQLKNVNMSGLALDCPTLGGTPSSKPAYQAGIMYEVYKDGVLIEKIFATYMGWFRTSNPNDVLAGYTLDKDVYLSVLNLQNNTADAITQLNYPQYANNLSVRSKFTYSNPEICNGQSYTSQFTFKAYYIIGTTAQGFLTGWSWCVASAVGEKTVDKAKTIINISNENAVICKGQNITFQAATVTGDQIGFFKDAAATIPYNATNQLTLNSNTYVIGLNEFWVKVMNQGCIPVIKKVQFTVNDSPSNLVLTGAQNSYCKGVPLIITPSANGSNLTYEWSSTSNFATLLDSNFVDTQGRLNFSPSTIGNATYYVRARNSSNCSTDSQQVSFNVITGITNFQITNNGNAFCNNQPITFTAGATGATNYQWYKDSLGAISIGSGTSVTVGTSNWVYGNNTIYVRATNLACQTDLIPVNFTVNQVPTTLQVSGNTSNYCIGNPISITPTAVGGTGITYEWSGNSNFATLLDSTFVDATGKLNYTPNSAGSYTYYVRAKSTSGTCYSAPETVTFSVSNQVSNVNVTNQNAVVCSGLPVTFTAAATNATAYKWTSDNQGVNVIGSNSSLTLQPVDYVLGSNVIYLTVSNAGGCNVSAIPVNFTVNQSPTNLEVAGAMSTYCTGSQVLITPSATGTNLTYQWSINSNFTTLLDASFVDSQGRLNFIPTTTGSQTYYARAFNGNCYSATKIVTFSVNTGVSNLQVTNNGSVFCKGDVISFTAGGTNATTYSWYKFSNGTGLIQTGSTYAPQTSDYVLGSLMTIYVQASNGNGCQTALMPITYTVNPSPENLQILGNSNNYCVGSAVLITPSATMQGSSANISYEWSLTSNFAAQLDPTMVDSQGRLSYTPNSTGAGSFFVRAKSNNNCYSPVVPVTFTINANIGTLSVTNQNAIVCKGDNVTFTAGATGATAYTWYQDAAGTMSIGTNQSITMQPTQYLLGLNKIYVQAKGAGGCVSPILEVKFTVNQSPTNLVLTGGQSTYCVGNQILVTPSATGTGLTYEWSTNNNFTTLLDSNFVDSQGKLNYIPSSTGSVTYYVRAFNGSCYSLVVPFTFTVNGGVSGLQVSNNNGSFCQGQSVSFTAGATGATNFNWYKFSNGTGSLGTGATYTPQSSDYTLDTLMTIYVQASNGNGCQTALTPVIYTVYTKPYDLQLTGNTSGYCIGSPIFIQPTVSIGTGTPTFEWSSTSNFANLLGSAFVDAQGNLSYTPTASGTFTYYVRAKGNGCYSDTKTVSFAVSNQVSNITVTPSNPTVCSGLPVSFTAAATNATSYSWSSDAQGVNVIGSSSSITLQPAQYVFGTNTIYLKVGNGGNCNVTPMPVSFTVNESPTNLELTGAQATYCTGSPVMVSPSALGSNLVYEWSLNSNFTSILGSQFVDTQGNLAYTPTSTGTATYYVRAKNSSGCVTATKILTFVVNQGVTNLQVTNNGANFCQGSTISFTAGALNATTYSWFKFSNGTGLLGTGANFTPSASQYSLGANTIYVQASSGNNCSTTLMPINFTVYAVPSNLQVTGNANTYCLGVPVFIEPTATGGNANVYEWSVTSNFANLLGSTFVDAQGNLAYTPSGTGTFTYYVRAKGSGNCYSDTKTVTFTVSNQVSNITVTPSNPTVCSGSPVTFTASANNATSYSWSSDAQGVNVLGTNSSITLQPSQYVLGTNTIYLKVGNAGNCNITPMAVHFTVNESPSTLVLAGAQTSYCSGSQVLITPSATGNNLTYQWSANSNFSTILGTSFVDNQGRLNFVSNTLGSVTYYARASNGTNCYSNIESVTFNTTQGVSGLQISNNNGSFCQGQTFSFTAGATGATTFNWYKFSNGTGLLSTGATFTPTPSDYVLGANTIYVQAVSSNSTCSTAINPVNFTVNESPTGIAFTGDTNYCLGQSVYVEPSAIGNNLSYQWSTTSNFAPANILGTAFVDAQGNLAYTPTTIGTKLYYVRAFNGSCYSEGIPVTIIVNAQPASLAVNKLTNIGQTSYCQNGNIEKYLATGVNITTYKWYTDASLTQEVLAAYLTGTNNNTLNVDPTIWAVGNYNIYCVGENSNGCKTAPTVVTFSVISGITPITPSINNFSMCQSETKTVTLDNPNNFTILWFTNSAGTTALSNSFISNNGNTLILPASAFSNGQTTLYYKVQNSGGCTSALSPLSFTVLTAPSNLTVTNNNASACIGQSIVFEASAQNVSEFLWYKNYTTGLVAEPQYVTGTNNYKLTIPSGNFTAGSYTYTVVAKNSSGCLTTPVDVHFTVQSVPSNSTITGLTDYCKSETIHFELLNSSSTATFKWYNDANGLNPVDPTYLSGNGSLLNIPASTFTTGSHTLYYYTTNGSCNSPTQSISFNVKETPSNLNTSGNQGTYCFGDQIDIVVGSQGGATNYEWFSDAAASLQLNPIYIIGNMHERLSTNNYPNGSHIVYVRAVNSNGCKSALLPISFTVNAAPAISIFATNNATIQTGNPINFNISGTGYTRWKILFNGSQIAPTGGGWNQGTTLNYVVNNSATLGNAGNYTLVISNGTCETQRNFTLYVIPQITITHDKLQNIGTDNGLTKVILNQHDDITFSSSVGTSGNYSEEWDYGDGFNNNTVQGKHFYNNAGEFTVKLKVTNNSNGDIFNLQYQYPILVKPEDNVISTDVLNAPDTNYTIFPNPYKEFLGLKFQGTVGDKFVIRVYSITGISLFSADWIADGVNWDKKWYNPLITAPQGTYIVVVNNVTKGTVWNGKLLKQ